MKIRIKNESNGRYFKCMTAIGPCMSETFETATIFEDGWDAYNVIKQSGVMAGAMMQMVNEHDMPCTITGRPQ